MRDRGVRFAPTLFEQRWVCNVRRGAGASGQGSDKTLASDGSGRAAANGYSAVGRRANSRTPRVVWLWCTATPTGWVSSCWS